MKRSKTVNLTILTLLAASFGTACAKDPELKHCVDQNGVVVDESQCANQITHGGAIMPFRWYYGGTGLFSPGSKISGGSFTPSAGHVYSSPSTVSRGGFGSIGHGSSSFSAGS